MICVKCKQDKTETHFKKDNRHTAGYTKNCTACWTADYRKYILKDSYTKPDDLYNFVLINMKVSGIDS